MLAYVAGLGREDNGRLAVQREQHVRVAVDDHEPRQVGHRPLEARVLAAGDDGGVEVVSRERLPDVPEPPLDLGAHRSHDASSPLISAVTASFSGAPTPWSRPNRAMPPFR